MRSQNKQDKHLPSGSIIYYSRRQDPLVPVMCGSCRRERLVGLNQISHKNFTGICQSCTKHESLQDENLPNGSVIFWSRRAHQHVPVRCGICGRERISHAAGIRTETFTGLCRSCLHLGPGSTNWRGGRVDKNGYVYVKVYPEHPFYDSMANNMGYIAEHRLVMAEHLGRPLEDTEVVHHKNAIKTDNRIENLELYVSLSEHTKAARQRLPHPGYVPLDIIFNIIVNWLKGLLESTE